MSGKFRPQAPSKRSEIPGIPRPKQVKSPYVSVRVGSQLDEDSIVSAKYHPIGNYASSIDDGSYISAKPSNAKTSVSQSPRGKRVLKTPNSGSSDVEDLYASLRSLANSASLETKNQGIYKMNIMSSIPQSQESV